MYPPQYLLSGVQTQALHTQQHTKYFSFAWSEKATKLLFCLSGLSSPTVLCTLNYRCVLPVIFIHRIYVWLVHMYTAMCPFCNAGFAGAVLDIANCNLTTVQPQPISPHWCLILSLPTSQIQEEKTSESERWQNVSGALGSCCYCCTVVVSPNSPTETGWVTSQRQAHRQ